MENFQISLNVGSKQNFVAFGIFLKLCKTRNLAFPIKMEDKCEKQIYKPLEVFKRLVSLFDLDEFGEKIGSLFWIRIQVKV